MNKRKLRRGRQMEEPYVTSIVIEAKDYDELYTLAVEDRRTVSSYVRQVLEDHLRSKQRHANGSKQ